MGGFMRGWQRMDRDIQRGLDEAGESGDPEEIEREIQFAKEAYAAGTGVMIGGAVGSLILPGVGTVIGAAIGGFFGNSVAKK